MVQIIESKRDIFFKLEGAREVRRLGKKFSSNKNELKPILTMMCLLQTKILQ
jgi:hypothetical protein